MITHEECLLFLDKVTIDGQTEDLTRANNLNETVIEDLGYLKCGMRTGEINKLTDVAIDENIEEMQLCPYKLADAKALAKRTIDLNQ